ncbi:hypothetical protein G5B00_14555 [Parapedobacter sp. SGR-10]|uniref:heparinase II/III domain-containing protein n=1 Tax=Parapedobacter sp. SGR-10 TaxID=2710879 RepID=UPI0013D234A4|nr:heparinase II/III family protein [Parapedobacter sp. SGR-10]NGF57737.1 hypothetical protein [Parapedobacter sp. SGR-10]
MMPNALRVFFTFFVLMCISLWEQQAKGATTVSSIPMGLQDFIPLYPDRMKGEDWLHNLDTKHPRMFVNNSTLAAMRIYVLTKQKDRFDKLVKEVDKLPDRAPFVLKESLVKTLPSGEKVPLGKGSYGIRHFEYHGGEEAVKLALVYLVKGDKKYAEKAKSYLRLFNQVLAWTSKNGLKMEHTGYSRINAFTAYDWICSGMTVEEKKEILDPMLEYTRKASRRKGEFTFKRTFGGAAAGNYGEDALIWFAGLAGHGEGVNDSLTEQFIKDGAKLFVNMLNHREKSAAGSGVLGAATVTYSFGDYPHATFNFFHTWQSAFGEDLSKKWTQMLDFPIWFDWAKIKFVNGRMLYHGIGDLSHENNLFAVRQQYSHYAQIAHLYSKSYPAKAAYVYAYMKDLVDNNVGSNVGGLFPFIPYILIHFDEGEVKKNQYTKKYLPYFYSPFYGILLMRSGEKAEDTYASFRMGASAGNHQHYDELSFIIYKKDFLALDAGSRTTTAHHHNFAAQSVAHNTLLIHHPKEDMPHFWKPAGFKADGSTYYNHGGQYVKDKAKPVALTGSEDFIYAVGDASKSYSLVKSKEVIRQFLYLKPDIFVVYDRVVSVEADQKKEFLLHFQNKPYFSSDSLEWGSVNGGKLMVKTVLPLKPRFHVVGGEGKEFWASGRNWELPLRDAWDQTYKLTGKWRVEVSDAASRERTNFLHVLQATGDDKESLVHTAIDQRVDNKDVLKLIDTQGNNWTLVYNRTGEVGLTVEKRSKDKVLIYCQQLPNNVQ